MVYIHPSYYLISWVAHPKFCLSFFSKESTLICWSQNRPIWKHWAISNRSIDPPIYSSSPWKFNFGQKMWDRNVGELGTYWELVGNPLRNWWEDIANNPKTNFPLLPNLKRKENKGVCHIVALPFTAKSILRQKKN